jgi:inhibitor of cysteine peptidase
MKTLTSAIGTSLLFLAAVVLTACGEEAGTGSHVPEVVDVTAGDAGGTVQLAPDDEVRITLESNVTTGYSWELVGQPDAAVLELVDSTYVEPETELVGAGGEEVWTFRAVGEGSTRLELDYVGPSGETPDEPFALNVDVSV